MEYGAQADGLQQPDVDGLVYLKLLGVVISQDSDEAISIGFGFGMGGVPFCSARLPLLNSPITDLDQAVKHSVDHNLLRRSGWGAETGPNSQIH